MPIESVRLLLEWAVVADEMTAICIEQGAEDWSLWTKERKARFATAQKTRWDVEDQMRAHARKLRETAAGMSEAEE